MAEYQKIFSVSDLPDGSMKTIIIKGKRIAVANVGNDFFALDDTCSHEECSLGTEGFLEGTVIICGCHGAQFDATDGSVLSLPATQPIKSYKLKKEGDDILIEI